MRRLRRKRSRGARRCRSKKARARRAGCGCRRAREPCGFLALFFALLYAALGYYTLFKHPGFFEGGRYLLPALGAFATVWSAGVLALVPIRFARIVPLATLGFFTLWNIGCALNLTQVLIPLYAPK